MAIRPVLIMAGGTGGHVYPALAIAEYMRGRGAKLCWLGTKNGLESRVVPENNFEFLTIKISGLRGTSIIRWLLAPIAILVAIVHSLKIMINLKPAMVIGMGGFVSGPGGIAAWMLRIPLLIHEQNSIAGLTNKILSPFARTILQGFPSAFSGSKVLTTGNPVRFEIIQKAIEVDSRIIDKQGMPLHLLVLGGSLGAKVLNDLIPAVLGRLPRQINVVVLHQTGPTHLSTTLQAYTAADLVPDQVVPYIEDMAEAYAWADLVICRAGALTVSEISIMGLTSIFVPYPYAADDHQTMNARYLTDAGGGVLLPQGELTQEKLIELISYFHDSRGAIDKMSKIVRQKSRPDATETIGNLCLEVANA